VLYNVTWGGVLAFLCYIICGLYVDLQTGGTEPTRGWQTYNGDGRSGRCRVGRMGHDPRKISVRWDMTHLTHPVIDMYVCRLSSVKLGKKD